MPICAPSVPFHSFAGNGWLYKNKDRGLLSTTASLGALCLWNVDEALQHLDKHQYSSDSNIKAGALLGACTMFPVLEGYLHRICVARLFRGESAS